MASRTRTVRSSDALSFRVYKTLPVSTTLSSPPARTESPTGPHASELRRTLLCLPLLAAGGWVLLRALHTSVAPIRLPAALALPGSAPPALVACAWLLGLGLLATAVWVAGARPAHLAWAWLGALLLTSAALAAAILAGWLAGGVDWVLLALALASAVLLVLPGSRAAFLG